MPVVVGLSSITGITTSVNSTDSAYKEYVDNLYLSQVPSPDNSQNQFLTTNGSTSSWTPIGQSLEYSSAGNYTFNVPDVAKEFLIEATGAGGGGGSATTDGTSYVPASAWRQRTAGIGVIVSTEIRNIF